MLNAVRCPLYIAEHIPHDAKTRQFLLSQGPIQVCACKVTLIPALTLELISLSNQRMFFRDLDLINSADFNIIFVDSAAPPGSLLVRPQKFNDPAVWCNAKIRAKECTSLISHHMNGC